MLFLFLFLVAVSIPLNIFIIKLSLIRFLAVISLVLGVFRLFDYFSFGNQHHSYALVWAIHALITGILLLWFSRNDQSQLSSGQH